MRQLLRPILVTGFFCHNKLFPNAARARVILIDEHGNILLVRHWAGRRAAWSLPGGGVKKGELPAVAAQRELAEELGADFAIDRFEDLARLQVEYPAELYVVRCRRTELPPQPFNRHEIVTASWFTLADLPQRLSSVANQAIAELSKK